MGTRTHGDYNVGWICALPVEGAAAVAMLDECHNQLPQHPSDHNSYTLGRIGHHNVVIACLPYGRTGTNSAAIVASHMGYSFDSIKVNLMVGIGGGVPSKRHDVRLGDVVVSKPGSKNGGVVQYDFGKTVEAGEFKHTNTIDATSPALLTALSTMQMRQYVDGNSFTRYLSELPLYMHSEFAYPGIEQDQLFEPEYDHVGGETCQSCDCEKRVQRTPRSSADPRVHYGTIVSGSRVMMHGATREKLRQKFDALCFEMEAAGLMSHFRCAVIRGIGDYADSHKNKQWQPYAAAAAAAYAKALLAVIPPENVTIRPPPAPLEPVPRSLPSPLHNSLDKVDITGISPTPSFIIGVPGFIDMSVRLTSWLITRVQKYAETDSVAVGLLQNLKARQTAMEPIFQLARQVSSHLGPEFEQDIEDELSSLHKSLVKAYRRGVGLKLFAPDPVNTVDFLYWGKTAVKSLLDEYDAWERTMQARLNVALASTEVEELIKEKIIPITRLRISSEEAVLNTPLDTNRLERLPCSWIYSQIHSVGTLVEFRYYDDAIANDPDEFSHFQRDMLDTVRFLRGADDSRALNIPKCISYYHDIHQQRFAMIHAVPRDYGHPRSLRETLTPMLGRKSKTSLLEVASKLGKIEPNNVAFVDKVLALARSDRGIRHPLNHRLQLANQLAKSILYVHSAQFVHKHVAPENILLLTRAGADKRGRFPYSLGDPFLVGFDRTRAEQVISTGRGELDIADCIYHHPERWGRTAGMRFSMLHDIYSLGVVLLEIALWDSLVVWLHEGFGFRRERFIAWKFIRDMFDEEAGSLKAGITAEDVQEALIGFAKHHIPLIMGEGYTNIVISCLSGDFKVEKADRFKDGGLGFVYMINVISKLEKLQLS